MGALPLALDPLAVERLHEQQDTEEVLAEPCADEAFLPSAAYVLPAQYALPAVAAREPARRSRLLFAMMAVSVGLHIAAAWAMLSGVPASADFGAIDKPSDTFSLSSMPTLVLESIVTEAVATATSASSAMPEGAIQAVDAEPQEQTKAEETVEPLEPVKAVDVAETAVPTDEDLHVLHGSAEPADLIEAKAVQVEEQKEPDEARQEAERQDKSKKRREIAQRMRSRASTAGGASSRAAMADAAASGQVSASRGNLLSYGALVRAKVARNRPGSLGRHGEAKVAFGIAPTGELSFARLATSSGDTAIDQAALEAVRASAPFEAPPADAVPDQLRFAIRFTFR